MKDCTFYCFRRSEAKGDDYSRRGDLYGQCIPTMVAMSMLRPYSVVTGEEIIDVECEDVTDVTPSPAHGGR